MESQKTLNRQNNFEKEKDRGINPLISDYVPKLQASKQYGTSTKTDTQINGTEINPHIYGQLIYNKRVENI